MKSGVGVIKNNKNGKVFYCSSSDIIRCLKRHEIDLKGNVELNTDMQKDYNKHSKHFSFEVINYISTPESRKQAAKLMLDSYNNSYNIGYEAGRPRKSTYVLAFEKDERIIYNILLKINDDFLNDGNYYCYDFFGMCRDIKITPEEMFRFLGINSKKTFNLYRNLIDEIYIGICWNKEGIFLIVFNNEKTSKESIFVPVTYEI